MNTLFVLAVLLPMATATPLEDTVRFDATRPAHAYMDVWSTLRRRFWAKECAGSVRCPRSLMKKNPVGG